MALLRTLDDKIRFSIRDEQTLLVGRIPECDVELEDGSVSSQHARLHMERHILHLQDLDSTNGTRVNYAMIDGPTVLLDGDTVEFGNVTFTVDGPELCSPGEEENAEPEALTSLEPIAEPIGLEATMQIPDIGDLEPGPVRPKPDLKVSRPEPKHDDDIRFDTESAPRFGSLEEPAATAFAVALILIGGGIALLLLFVNRISTSF
jgi:predicted component of type VI protein secretion system